MNSREIELHKEIILKFVELYKLSEEVKKTFDELRAEKVETDSDVLVPTVLWLRGKQLLQELEEKEKQFNELLSELDELLSSKN